MVLGVAAASRVFNVVKSFPQSGGHTPGAKAPRLWRLFVAKAKALAYLEAKANADSLRE